MLMRDLVADRPHSVLRSLVKSNLSAVKQPHSQLRQQPYFLTQSLFTIKRLPECYLF